MEKLKIESVDMTQRSIEKIAAIFPNVITEMIDEEKSTPDKRVFKLGVNFELLKQQLSGYVIDGEEHYEFTWVGKKAAILEGNKPIRKTFRPCVEESKDWENTGNLYIEGDNMEVLKLLQESYLNSIKLIYIDPPYNTGNDSFVYNDSFKMDEVEYNEETGYFDEEGNIQFKQNEKTNPRYHSDWCSMIYPRLMLAHNLLKEDGVIFISIDDYEVDNLRKIGNEIFGESNFVAQVVWERAFSPKNDAKYFSNSHDYVLVYAKDINSFSIGKLERTSEANERYKNPDNDPRGVWTSGDLTVKTYSAAYDYEIVTPGGKVVRPTDGRCWFTNKERMKELIEDNRIWFGNDGNNTPRLKRFLSEVQSGMVPISIWYNKDVGHNQEGRQELKKLFDNKGFFDGPKPVRLLSRILKVANVGVNDIILDFFSGSATTAHAVMQLNAEDSGNRKFIMVQLPEPTEENSEAFKTGYKNICEIGKERIGRAGVKIIEDNNNIEGIDKLDVGFRVFKVDSTNMKDVYYAANEYTQDMLAALESNIKDDRTDIDLLYGVILDWGLPLSLSHKIEKIENVTVHTVDGGSLVACFAEKVSEGVIQELAKRQPLRMVFRDSCFNNSPDKINVEEIFKLHAPNTTVKVI
jgi:adenine-specific DNA-methyltransferase